MEILVPVDASRCSQRALSHAISLAWAMEGTVDVVHFSEFENEAVSELEANIQGVLEESGVGGEASIVGDIRLSSLRASNRIGSDILAYAEKGAYDHIVMGHHGTGAVGELLLGSAAETVLKNTEIPVTVVP
jgi:nucleotide-binding universal stress UspA family protein